ncbi:MAG: RNA 2',3'-cyclic phosphodiesterase [Dehalococcoidia bacterium]|jgi:2'-5' RNA ligase|nr:RNA 2',3'-cyclic phosphodiesterase [Dehalococcoidia bacterium]
MRLFVAVELPELWREDARAARGALERNLTSTAPAAPAVTERLRWVDPALMHLTLRFTGEVDYGLLGPLQAALDRCGDVDVELSLGAAGTFGPASRTQVVWLEVEGGPPLAGLAADVEAAVASTGIAADGRAFRAHITLARVHRRASKEERRAIAAAVRALDPPAVWRRPVAQAFRARSIALVRSHLAATGPRYEVLSRHGGGGGGDRAGG